MSAFVLIPFLQDFFDKGNEIFLEKAETNFETGIENCLLLVY